mmetsp:Transcript_31908/g.80014  ORF Transcript_31908/g.80014 Transcript_31908/m.80014 type:complete len:217 (+) Transcript_31908:68-718(+)
MSAGIGNVEASPSSAMLDSLTSTPSLENTATSNMQRQIHELARYSSWTGRLTMSSLATVAVKARRGTPWYMAWGNATLDPMDPSSSCACRVMGTSTTTLPSTLMRSIRRVWPLRRHSSFTSSTPPTTTDRSRTGKPVTQQMQNPCSPRSSGCTTFTPTCRSQCTSKKRADSMCGCTPTTSMSSRSMHSRGMVGRSTLEKKPTFTFTDTGHFWPGNP